jgi:hypothetical protein
MVVLCLSLLCMYFCSGFFKGIPWPVLECSEFKYPWISHPASRIKSHVHYNPQICILPLCSQPNSENYPSQRWVRAGQKKWKSFHFLPRPDTPWPLSHLRTHQQLCSLTPLQPQWPCLQVNTCHLCTLALALAPLIPFFSHLAQTLLKCLPVNEAHPHHPFLNFTLHFLCLAWFLLSVVHVTIWNTASILWVYLVNCQLVPL